MTFFRYARFGMGVGWGARAKAELEGLIEDSGMPLVLCHNDILLANIIYDEVKDSVSFIDFEYCFPNYAPFDLANHFNEFAGWNWNSRSSILLHLNESTHF